MTEREMFEKSFERPRNFLKLSPQEQWDIDKRLGILDWAGNLSLTEEEMTRFNNHYKPMSEEIKEITVTSPVYPYKAKTTKTVWKHRKELPDAKCDLWDADWCSSDGDGVSLYIDKLTNTSGGFELCCFSGIPASKIYVDNVDFGTMWRKANYKTRINEHTYEEQCVMIADYLCEIFCDKL
jgi:hypothetical protein